MNPAEPYNRLHFEHRIEAAAFVAALSRYLNSPGWTSGHAGPIWIELWAIAGAAPEGGMDLYLNDAAAVAAATAFSPVPLTSVATLPPSAQPMLLGTQVPAWGRAEAEGYLPSKLED